MTHEHEMEGFMTALLALLRHPFLVLGAVLVFAGLAVGVVALSPDLYQAQSSFTAKDTGTNTGGLAQLAGTLGVTLPGQTGTPSGFYLQLVRSRTVLESVARTKYHVGDRSADLIALLAPSAETRRDSLDEVVATLRDDVVGSDFDDQSGIYYLTTDTNSPRLAEQINRRLLEVIDSIDIDRRRESARAEREFLETRVKQVNAQYEEASEALQRFLRRNPSFGASPVLGVEYQQRAGDALMYQRIYAFLVEALERARMEEARTIPTLTIIDPPEGSAEESRMGIVLAALLGAGLGLVVVAIGLGIHAYFVRVRQTSPEQARELRHLTIERLR